MIRFDARLSLDLVVGLKTAPLPEPDHRTMSMETSVDPGPTPDIILLVTQVASALVRSHARLLAERDDLIQEGLVALWEEGVSQAGGLAVVIAKRRMIDYLRKHQGRAGSSRYRSFHQTRSIDGPLTSDGGRFTGIPRDPSPSDFKRIDDLLEIEAISERVAQMPARQREAMHLTLQGWTLAQIAGRFDVTESRVCQILGDARHNLTHPSCEVTLIQCRQRARGIGREDT